MDSRKDSTSIRNSLRLDSDSEKNPNGKGFARQRGANDNAENVFTSISNATGSNLGPQNGPLPRQTNCSANEAVPQANRSGENSFELNKNLGGSNRGHNQNKSHADLSEAASSNKIEPNACDKETQSCQRHKVCLEKVANNYNAPSTSGTSRDAENAGFRENRKRPSTLKLNRPNLEGDDSSSDTGNDDYSLGSEDGCIYTYRGGQHLADLPSSFFSLDMGLPLDRHLPTPPNYQVAQGPAREPGSRASSPDMDFLEMDFDPGPSCEVDTGDESTPDAELEEVSNMPEENEPILRGTSPEYLPAATYDPLPDVPVPSGSHSDADIYFCNVPSTSRGLSSGGGDTGDHSRGSQINYGPFISHINVKGEQLLVRRTMSEKRDNSAVKPSETEKRDMELRDLLTGKWTPTNIVDFHVSTDDLVPREMSHFEEEHPDGPYAYQINPGNRIRFDSANISSATYHLNMVKKLIAESSEAEQRDQEVKVTTESVADAAGCSTDTRCVEPPRCMIWSEREACERQVTQIATSACGATAVVNVFIALGVPVNIEKINSAVGTRLRANNAPLPRYLLSRAVAGCTAADLVTGIQRASDGLVTARFFPTYPERAVSLSHWLADWISLGAVPILTLNLQAGCEGDIPDAWHHQMVFGVSSRGVFLCNPVECVRESSLWPRLTSPSELLVRSRDMLTRFTINTDLTPLMAVPDQRFHTFNVLGQVVNVIREWRCSGWSGCGTRTSHVRIPASYEAGITIAALTGSEAHRRLMHLPQLPIVNPQADPA